MLWYKEKDLQQLMNKLLKRSRIAASGWPFSCVRLVNRQLISSIPLGVKFGRFQLDKFLMELDVNRPGWSGYNWVLPSQQVVTVNWQQNHSFSGSDFCVISSRWPSSSRNQITLDQDFSLVLCYLRTEFKIICAGFPTTSFFPIFSSSPFSYLFHTTSYFFLFFSSNFLLTLFQE